MPPHRGPTRTRTFTLPGQVTITVSCDTAAAGALRIRARDKTGRATQVEIPSGSFRPFLDRLVGRGFTSAVPRVPVALLGERVRADAEQTGHEDDITVAHILEDLGDLLADAAGNRRILAALQRDAFERLQARGGTRFGAGHPRLRRANHPPLGPAWLLDCVDTTLAACGDDPAAAAEALLMETDVLYPHLRARPRRRADDARRAALTTWIRAPRGPRGAPLEIDVAIAALRLSGMTSAAAHDAFRYAKDREKKAATRSRP